MEIQFMREGKVEDQVRGPKRSRRGGGACTTLAVAKTVDGSGESRR